MGGGGFFTLHNIAKDPDSVKKRYCDGVAAKSKSDNSVKKIFIIALIPDVAEKYNNVRYVWKKLQLDNLEMPYTIATYLKLANVLARNMGHGSLHHCTFCDISRHDLYLGNYNICISTLNIKCLRIIDFEE